MHLSARALAFGLGVLTIAAPAWAEVAGAPDAAPGAGAESAESGGLPQIMVTARRRVEDSQSVPKAISVVDGTLLDQS